MSLVKHVLRYAYQRHGQNGYDHDHHNDGYSHRPYEAEYYAVPSAASLPTWLSKTGRRLIYILAIVAALLLVAVAVLLIVLVPLAIDAIEFLYRNGISGVMDHLPLIFDKLWNGVGS